MEMIAANNAALVVHARVTIIGHCCRCSSVYNLPVRCPCAALQD